MFLNMALMLAFASVMLEGLVAYRISAYRHLMQKAEWMAVAVSMAGSFFLGKIFGAEGLVCLMAGIMSTVVSPFMYKGLNYHEAHKDEITKQYQQFRQTVIDFGHLLWLVIRFLTFPFRAARAASVKYQTVKAKVQA